MAKKRVPTDRKASGTAKQNRDPYSVVSYTSKPKSNFQKRIDGWIHELKEFRERMAKKGRERLTIMVIPHTEKQILNFHLSVFTISGIIGVAAVILVVSIVSLVGKSGEDLTHYGMGLDNKQFKLQTLKMAEEMIPLHEIINLYTNTISELYVKLDGNEEETGGRGGVSQAVMDAEIVQLKQLMERCESDKSLCDQNLTKEMLRSVIFLSKEDNQKLRQAIRLSDKIIDELKSKEKQNILKHTPGIWPTKGYLLGLYGRQTDQLLGSEIFRRGVEIGALPGAEVYATAPGKVADITWDRNYGITVKIRHRYGIKTYYSHLDYVKVSGGQKVEKGQVIGFVGRSGNTPVYMLYYEIHIGTIAYNPHAFLNHLQDQWLIQPKTW